MLRCAEIYQAKGFELQFELAESSGLPVFFHSRACREDFADVVRRNRDRVSGGVVHSFTGTREEAAELVSMGAFPTLATGSGFWREALCLLRSLINIETVH